MTLAGTVAMVVFALANWSAPSVAWMQKNPPEQAPARVPEGTPTPTPLPAQTPSVTSPTAGKKATTKSRRHKVIKKDHRTDNKKVVRNGSTEEPIVLIAPGMSDEKALQNRQGTAQLLATTDANLKKLDLQQLDDSKQDVVKQIQTYVEQARTAEAAGDLDRAHNLAVKAQLLSDDLVSH